MKKVSFILFVFIVLVGSSCQDKVAKAEYEGFKIQQEIEEQNKLIVQSYLEGKYNDRRSEVLDEFLTDDITFHGASLQINGIEEYKQTYNFFSSALHDTQINIMTLIAEGDLVMSYATLKSVHKGQLGSLAPTGNELSVDGFTLFQLVDGKINTEWEIADALGMMTQLGLELQMKE